MRDRAYVEPQPSAQLAPVAPAEELLQRQAELVRIQHVVESHGELDNDLPRKWGIIEAV